MSVDAYTLVEICSPGDPLLVPWLDLYERAFPPAERIPVSGILKTLHERAGGIAHGSHILAAVPSSASEVTPCCAQLSALLFTYEPPLSQSAFLWYFAVSPEQRGNGLGSRLYRNLLARLEPQVRALIFDVEDPAQMKQPEERELARRRIGFYRRLGAHVLGGIEYTQRCAEYLPPLRLLLMIHPLAEITPREAYDLAKEAMPEAVQQVGEFKWI